MAIRTQPTQLIQRTPGVCGGAACIRQMRIPVWVLVEARQLGLTDAAILDGYPRLTARELAAAWDYERDHPDEIAQAIASNAAD